MCFNTFYLLPTCLPLLLVTIFLLVMLIIKEKWKFISFNFCFSFSLSLILISKDIQWKNMHSRCYNTHWAQLTILITHITFGALGSALLLMLDNFTLVLNVFSTKHRDLTHHIINIFGWEKAELVHLLF